MPDDVYVIGLLCALVVAGAIPITSNAALYLGLLLLAIVWLGVVEGKRLSGSTTGFDGIQLASTSTLTPLGALT
jgi:hypothetical protein